MTAPDPEPSHRDVAVNGAASMDGFEAIQRLLRGLPPDLPAALFVVIHRGSGDPDVRADCHGAMRDIRDGSLVRYRCHTGHAFTRESLGSIHADAWQRALYSAFCAQQVVGRMADDARRNGAPALTKQLQERAKSYDEGAVLLRRLVADAKELEAADANAAAAQATEDWDRRGASGTAHPGRPAE